MTDPTTTVLALELVTRGPDEADLVLSAALVEHQWAVCRRRTRVCVGGRVGAAAVDEDDVGLGGVGRGWRSDGRVGAT